MPNLALELSKQSATAFGVTRVYGERQDVNGVAFIPVSLSWSGFGAGQVSEDGNGGGGGGATIPIGAYVGRGKDLRFEPNVISLMAVGIPFVWVAGRALSRVFRALKRRR